MKSGSASSRSLLCGPRKFVKAAHAACSTEVRSGGVGAFGSIRPCFFKPHPELSGDHGVHRRIVFEDLLFSAHAGDERSRCIREGEFTAVTKSKRPPDDTTRSNVKRHVEIRTVVLNDERVHLGDQRGSLGPKCVQKEIGRCIRPANLYVAKSTRLFRVRRPFLYMRNNRDEPRVTAQRLEVVAVLDLRGRTRVQAVIDGLA